MGPRGSPSPKDLVEACENLLGAEGLQDEVRKLMGEEASRGETSNGKIQACGSHCLSNLGSSLVEFGESTRDCSPGHAGKEGPHLAMSGESRPSASQLLAFSPGKEQAAGVWET